MEGSFSGIMNQADRGGIGGTPMVIQQYARYPSTLEPGLHSASSLGSARSRLDASKSPPLHRKATPRSLQSSPTGLRSGIPPVSTARSGPSMSPPVFDSVRQRQAPDSIDRAESRPLPSRDVTDETIDDAYVMFIFYCNPNVPSSADPTELRKTFRCPPRSDGKSFSIFTLWELIRKLDQKELKTWIQLAIELGVEPPDMEKKQSTQKVQQYAVRLKRWMRAMHVDAFFEYCLGHPHPYYNQLPATNAAVSDSRDGVPLEEDLALRALVPEWKPKRGRRRADERDNVHERLAKRPHLETSVGILPAGSFHIHSAAFPPSAIPFSAFADEIESNDPWMAAASSFGADGPADASTAQHGQEIRWRPLERDVSPAGYPHSAIIPRGHPSSEGFLSSSEPRSAVTPLTGEKARPKRRHGPAVSSAWPNTSGSVTGKTRGRPPNRGTVSGPFSSFPVNPSRSEPSHRYSTSILDQDSASRLPNSHYQQSPTPFSHTVGNRPNKLQLQVPQHSGAPVRLATPPTLMMNGIDNTSDSLKAEQNNRNGSSAALNSNTNSTVHVTTDNVTRALVGELLRGRLTGRAAPLSPEEARALASSVVTNLMASYSQLPLGLPALVSALHLGLGCHFGYTGIMQSAMVVNVEPAPAASIDGPGMPGSDGMSSNFYYSISQEYRHGSRFVTKVTYSDLNISNAGARKPEETSRTTEELGNSVVELDSLTDAEYEVDGADSSVPEGTWKQRYLKLRAQMQKRERSLSQYKRKILESVMSDL